MNKLKSSYRESVVVELSPHSRSDPHMMRMEGKRIPKRVLEWKPTGRRNRGRSRKRWIEDIEEDIQIMGIRGWRKLCKERAKWKKITEKAKAHSGL